MAKVLPSINCHFKDTHAVVARIAAIESLFDKAGTPTEDRLAHFDIADGLFTFHKSWNEPERLAELAPKFQFEAHLMVEDPASEAERWLAAGAKRIAVHAEVVSPTVFQEISAAASKAGAEVVLAVNPETPHSALEEYFQSATDFLIMSVHPGLSGQKFLPLVLEKISFLRRELPNVRIGVDGGINLATAKQSFDAGADWIVSDSHIFNSPDPTAAYMELLKQN